MLFPSLIYKKRKRKKHMKNYEKPTIIVSQDESECLDFAAADLS